jgi:hypothetical protein
MCRFFGVPRAYYAWESKLGETDPDQERMQKIQAVYRPLTKATGIGGLRSISSENRVFGSITRLFCG